MLRKLLAACLMVLAGCGYQTPLHTPSGPKITFHTDPSFQTRERDCLESAAQQWNTQTAGMVEVKYQYDLKPGSFENYFLNRTVRWLSTDKAVKDEDSEQEFLCRSQGLADDCNNYRLFGQVNSSKNFRDGMPVEMRIVADRLFDERNDCKLTVMHELGHVFGLNHDPDSKAIMFRAVKSDRSTCLTSMDTKAFCALYDCSGVFVTPCGAK